MNPNISVYKIILSNIYKWEREACLGTTCTWHPKINLVLFVYDHQMTMYHQFVIDYFNSVRESTYIFYHTVWRNTLSLYFFHTQKMSLPLFIICF